MKIFSVPVIAFYILGFSEGKMVTPFGKISIFDAAVCLEPIYQKGFLYYIGFSEPILAVSEL